MDIQSTMKEYYEQFYDQKFDNLDEMDPLFERHELLKLTQEEIGTLSRPIDMGEIE